MCQPEASQEASAGLSNRGYVIQGIGYVGDGRAKKRNQRGDGPEISHSSSTPMAGRTAGRGVVAEFRRQGVTIRVWVCCGASAGNREGGARHTQASLFSACASFNLLPVPPIGHTHP